MLAFALRRVGLEMLEEIGRWFFMTRTYSYEIFVDAVLSDISELLGADRISLLRLNERDRKWTLIASTGIMKMSGSYDLSDIPTYEPEDDTWIISPTEGVGNDAVYFFYESFSDTYYAIGIDDVETARDYTGRSGELKKIGLSMKEAILLKLRLLHSESVIVDKRVYEDDLTGLPNRRAWEQELGDITSAETGVFLVMIDLDHFKRINDELGHGKGDEVLKEFSRALKYLREVCGNCFFARFGGEEFSGIIHGERDDVTIFFQQLQAKIAEIKVIPWKLTFSAGACEYDGELEIKKVFDAADFAAYAAKQGGRNRWVFVRDAEVMKRSLIGKSQGEIVRLLCGE